MLCEDPSEMTASESTTSPAIDTLTGDATVAALEHGTVVRWWQTTAFLRVAGPDAAMLLDGLCTQACERIEPGHAVPGLFLDTKAKLIAPAILHRAAGATWTDPRSGEDVDGAPVLLLETLPDLVEPLRAHVTKYRLRAKVAIEPAELSTIALAGGALAGVVPEPGWSRLADQHIPTHVLVGTQAACAAAVRAASDAGTPLADPDAFEAARIDAGIAGLHDMLAGRMPAEIGGMRSAVALDAGCYLGQEPVARLHYRGHANRTLRRLRSDEDITPNLTPPDEEPDLDTALALRRIEDSDDARPVGRLTTWARHPGGGSVALAVVRREVGMGEFVRLASTDAKLELVDGPDGD